MTLDLIFFLEFGMAANIAQTSFGTTPDDKAVVVDVYGTPPLQPVNTNTGFVDDGALNQVSGLNNLGASIFKSIAKNYIQTGKAIDLSQWNKKAALDRVKKSLGVDRASLTSLGGKTLDAVLKGSGFYDTGIGKVVNGIANATTANAMDKKTLGGYRDLSITINGVKKFVKNVGDVESLSDLSKFLANATGDDAFIKAANLTEIAGTIKGINDLASEFQIPGVLDRLMADMDDNDKRYVSGLIAAGTTSITEFTTIDNFLDNLTGSELINSNPDIISVLLQNIQPTTEYPVPSEEVATALEQRLTKISPNWWQVNVGGDQWRDNLDVFKSLSTITRDSFLIANKYRSQIAVADSYNSRSFVVSANTAYPLIGLAEL